MSRFYPTSQESYLAQFDGHHTQKEWQDQAICRLSKVKCAQDIIHRPGVQQVIADYLSQLDSGEPGTGVHDDFPDDDFLHLFPTIFR